MTFWLIFRHTMHCVVSTCLKDFLEMTATSSRVSHKVCRSRGTELSTVFTMTMTARHATTAAATTRSKYRGGFNSSICNLFKNYKEKSDCCALACCGLLLSDKTKFLLQGTRASWCKRLSINIGIPVAYLLCMHLLIQTAEDEDLKARGQFWKYVGLIVLVIVLSLRARQERIKFRKSVMQHMYQDQLQGQQRSELVSHNIRMHHRDMRLAHASLCCYPNDEELYVAVDGEESSEYIQPPLQPDFCTRLWSLLQTLCCGCCCACWVQCFGMCAIGQEYRQVRSSVDENMDYVTFEKFDEYYPKIAELRQHCIKSFWPHARALSQLSKKLLNILGMALVVLLVISLIPVLLRENREEKFTPLNLLVLLATLFQSVFILYWVHWKWCRLDLSLDAVIKYFSSGFVLCTGLALAYEMVISTLFKVFEVILLFIGFLVEEEEGDFNEDDLFNDNDSKDHEKDIKDFVKDFAWIFILAAFLNSFVVAALVEELSKYFSYWMVEHPDFDALDRVASATVSTYSLVDTQEEEQEADLEQRDMELDDEERNGSANGVLTNEGTDASQTRTLESLGRGITVAMVATAVGFACCENLLYVFLYTPPTVSNELSTLFLRSLLPVHPLAAAIQSIGVCQRDLEGRKDVGVGKIIFPAWLLHGSFDFVLMVYAIWSILSNNTSDDENEEDASTEADDELPDAKQIVKLMTIPAILVILGVVYYVCMARTQRKRLAGIVGKQDASKKRGAIAMVPIV